MLNRLKERAHAYRSTLMAYSHDRNGVSSFEDVALTKGEVETVEASILTLSNELLGSDPPENLWLPLGTYAQRNYAPQKEWADNEAEYFRWFLMGIEKTYIFLDYLEGFQEAGQSEKSAERAKSASPSSRKPVLDILEEMRSVFISYGGPDERFATKMNDALRRVGVRTFFFPDDAIPGAKLHREMSKGINEFERILLICSSNSLNRPGVVNELEKALQREAREGGHAILIPITIDDYVFRDWRPENTDVAQEVRDRVIADFRNTHEDSAAFERALGRVVAALIRS